MWSCSSLQGPIKEPSSSLIAPRGRCVRPAVPPSETKRAACAHPQSLQECVNLKPQGTEQIRPCHVRAIVAQDQCLVKKVDTASQHCSERAVTSATQSQTPEQKSLWLPHCLHLDSLSESVWAPRRVTARRRRIPNRCTSCPTDAPETARDRATNLPKPKESSRVL